MRRRPLWVPLLLCLLFGLVALGPAQPARAAGADMSCNEAAPDAQSVGKNLIVLLVHGWQDGPRTWEGNMLDALHLIKGATTRRFDYQAYHDRWVTDPHIGPALARTIQCYADASTKSGGPGKIVLVGHSEGGLAIRCALNVACGAVRGNDQRAGMVITIGTPNLGSLLQVRGVSGAQTVGGGALFMACESLNLPTLALTPGLNDLCNWLHGAATGSASHAFIQGSDELRALPPFQQGLPVHALAGDAHVGVKLFFAPPLTVDDGDLVVGVHSATTWTVDHPATVIDCGQWTIGQRALQAGALSFQPGACWHSTETSYQPFAQTVGRLIGDYAHEHRCGVNNGAAAVRAAVRKVPTAGYPWSTDPRDYAGTFDPCADLSGVLLPIAGAHSTSPVQVMLFHKGDYVGTATTEAFRSTFVDGRASTSDTVAVTYWYSRRWDTDTASVSGRARLQFHWDGHGVKMIGSLPADMTGPLLLNKPLISLDGYGPAFAWGTPQAQAEAALGAGTRFSVDAGGGTCQQAHLPGYSATFGIADGKVVVIAISQPPYGPLTDGITDTGIQVGDPISKVTAAYPGISVSPDPSDAASVRYTYTNNGRTAQFIRYGGSSTVNYMQFGLSGWVGEAPCV